MKRAIIIVAGGSGIRMGGNIPKQFLELTTGKPVIYFTLKHIKAADPTSQIILVIGKTHFTYYSAMKAEFPALLENVTLVEGGESRFESVKNGLKNLDTDVEYIAIHDGARPFVKKELLEKGWETVKAKQAVIPVISITSSLRKVENSNNFAVKRELYKTVQTPQFFKADLIQKAYEPDYKAEFTDDASVYENQIGKISLIEGNEMNIKITSPIDLECATVLLKKFFSD
ncbi:MAG: 2-C-methyl-D-erythritol 4-phosphate cytidylyltransferase [Chitinophagaceae bacterium]|nr:MAG: 2-C-methyl-D-erythritol 4-phosphate cytidylyltransferase [Chitinophagaceae bacterium]